MHSLQPLQAAWTLASSALRTQHRCVDHRLFSTLVLAEHKGGKLGGSTVNAVAAAAAIGAPITALVAGSGVSGVADSLAKVNGISKVLVAEHESLKHQCAEPLSLLLKHLQTRRSFTHILAPGTTFGKNVIPRAAALLDTQAVSDVAKVVDKDTFVRPIYAGNALATVKYSKPGLRIMTVRTASFPVDSKASSSGAAPAAVEAVSADELAPLAATSDWGVEWVGEDVKKSERPELASARVVVCGGRALKSAEHFQTLERLADLMGGAVGASRAAVDAGMCPNDLQVGQTGKVIAPELYIGLGISGAIQHLAGMKDSKTIVAINNDPEAPIFQVADYGLVQDLFVALPELEKELRALKAAA